MFLYVQESTRIVFGEAKRLANIDKHGFDFAEFEAAFSFDRFLSGPARPSRTGQRRFRLVGLWNEDAVVVAIISPLGGEAVALVSVRRAGRKERFAYDNV